nr:3'-5' exonuclease [Flaviflexus huanghaiensis]
MAFRNKGEILEAANTVASPLRRHAQQSGLTVPPLAAFIPSGGEVEISFETFKDESYRAIARDIAQYRDAHADMNDGRGPSAAVLCRARADFEPMAKALEELGIPYIAHGSQSAITQPEAKTVRALLRAVINPARGDELIRFMSYLNIAPADIEAVNVVRRSAERDEGARLSFIEALSFVDRADVSEAGRRRLAMLVRWMTTLTEARHARIEDLVSMAARITGLETEVASRSVRGGIGRASLAILQRMAAGYSETTEGATLDAFLTWLDLVEEKEKTGSDDMPLADLALQSGEVTKDELEDPHSVTIMTVHGAKGLEWDYVAIPELRYGGFDLLKQKHRDPWIGCAGKVPQWLRADAPSLPDWRWQNTQDKDELAESFARWDVDDMAEHENRERRRLAYVAMTRPRSRLLLAGYWYENHDKGRDCFAKLAEGKKADVGPSRLLLGLDVPALGVSLDELPEVTGESEAEIPSALWPDGLHRGGDVHVKDAAAVVAAQAPRSVAEMMEMARDRSPWLRDSLDDLIALLGRDEPDELDIGHLTANGVVAMASSPEEYRRNLERPIPSEPAVAARIGQQVHEHIALQYSAPRTGDLIDVSGEIEQVLGLDLLDPRVSALIAAFEDLDVVKAGLRPIAIEAPVDVTVADMPMRGTIDAVFDDGVNDVTGERRVRIVDWKTGRRPRDADLATRELQLHLYRFAWAKVTGTAPENIRASFAYLGEKDPTRRMYDVEPISAEELESRVSHLVEQVRIAGATADGLRRESLRSTGRPSATAAPSSRADQLQSSHQVH